MAAQTYGNTPERVGKTAGKKTRRQRDEDRGGLIKQQKPKKGKK